MKDLDLEKEARAFYWRRNPDKIIAENSRPDLVIGYVEGANSKHVEIEKLKFAIEQLYKFRESTFGKGKNVIIELELQLKQLQNGFTRTNN